MLPVRNFRTTFSHAAGFCWTFSGFRRSIAKLAVISRSLWHETQYWFTTEAVSAAGAGAIPIPGCPDSAAPARQIARTIVRCVSFMSVMYRNLTTSKHLSEAEFRLPVGAVYDRAEYFGTQSKWKWTYTVCAVIEG